MGYLKVSHIAEPDSSFVEAIGYSVIATGANWREAIYVQVNYGKIYEYVNESELVDFKAEFNKMVTADSVGSAYHAFKKRFRYENALDAGYGDKWGEYELEWVPEEAPVEVNEAQEEIDYEGVKEDPGLDNESAVYDFIGVNSQTKQMALAAALTLAEISGNGTLSDVLANADRVYEYLNK